MNENFTPRRAQRGTVRPVNDIRESEYAERLAHESPDEYLRRREFLQRAAVTAGLASGMATVLSSDTLVAEAARRQHRSLRPTAS